MFKEAEAPMGKILPIDKLAELAGIEKDDMISKLKELGKLRTKEEAAQARLVLAESIRSHVGEEGKFDLDQLTKSIDENAKALEAQRGMFEKTWDGIKRVWNFSVLGYKPVKWAAIIGGSYLLGKYVALPLAMKYIPGMEQFVAQVGERATAAWEAIQQWWGSSEAIANAKEAVAGAQEQAGELLGKAQDLASEGGAVDVPSATPTPTELPSAGEAADFLSDLGAK